MRTTNPNHLQQRRGTRPLRPRFARCFFLFLERGDGWGYRGDYRGVRDRGLGEGKGGKKGGEKREEEGYALFLFFSPFHFSF